MRIGLYLLAPLGYIYFYHIPMVTEGLEKRYGTKGRWVIDTEKDRVLQEHTRNANNDHDNKRAQKQSATTSPSPSPSQSSHNDIAVNQQHDNELALPMSYERE